jgi:hypothetical protein
MTDPARSSHPAEARTPNPESRALVSPCPPVVQHAFVSSEVPVSGDSRTVRLAVALGAACLAILFFWRLGTTPLLETDEGRYAEIAREMLASGDFVTPHLNGVIYFEKPPLHYWLTAAAMRILGLDELAARLWSALFGVLGVVLTYRLGREIGGTRAGLVGAAVLGTSPLYVTLGRVATIDMTVSLFITLTLACFWFAHRSADDRARRVCWHVAFLAAALAVLAKGLIGVVIPGAVVFLYLLVTGQWRVLRQVPWVTGGGLFLVVAVPWHVLAATRNPDFLWFYFIHEHVLRYLTPGAGRPGAFWYFPAVIIGGCMPWAGLFLSMPRLVHWRQGRSFFTKHPDVTFLLLWFGFVTLFFSASQSKLIPYILPALPPLAVLLGLLVESLRSGTLPGSRLETAGIAVGGSFTGLYGFGFLWAGSGKIDRLALGGVVSPGLLASGVVLVALATLVVAAGLGRSWRLRLLALFAGACCISAAIVPVGPLMARERSSKALAERVRSELRDGDLLLTYHCYPQSLPFYLQRTLDVVDWKGELEFGISHLSPEEGARRFPGSAEFKRLWDSDRRILAVGDGAWSQHMTAEGFTHARVLWTGLDRVLLSNERLAR